jgi:chloramphenicol-sensitive protein RarD
MTGRTLHPEDPERARWAHPTRSGLLFGIASYGIWGLVPIYFKAVAEVPAVEVVAHRVAWSMVILSGVLIAQRRLGEARAAMGDFRTLRVLVLTTILIATNWFLFIWAVAHDRVLQASLGYFINPLVNVFLGMVFLRERLSRAGAVAVLLAAIGVGYQAFLGGEFPWIALVLAFSFGLYGLLRKTARVGAVAGLTVETSLLVPAALVYLAWCGTRGTLHFGAGSATIDSLLILSGVVTAAPLLCFTVAARLLPLSTMGFLQYLAPSGHFLLAVLVYGEPLETHHLITFGCIWAALAIFSIDQLRRQRW